MQKCIQTLSPCHTFCISFNVNFPNFREICKGTEMAEIWLHNDFSTMLGTRRFFLMPMNSFLSHRGINKWEQLFTEAGKNYSQRTWPLKWDVRFWSPHFRRFLKQRMEKPAVLNGWVIQQVLVSVGLKLCAYKRPPMRGVLHPSS